MPNYHGVFSGTPFYNNTSGGISCLLFVDTLQLVENVLNTFPLDTRDSNNVDIMLYQRLWCWNNDVSTLIETPVSSGLMNYRNDQCPTDIRGWNNGDIRLSKEVPKRCSHGKVFCQYTASLYRKTPTVRAVITGKLTILIILIAACTNVYHY